MQKTKDRDEVIYFPEVSVFQYLGTLGHTFKNIARHVVGTPWVVTE